MHTAEQLSGILTLEQWEILCALAAHAPAVVRKEDFYQEIRDSAAIQQKFGTGTLAHPIQIRQAVERLIDLDLAKTPGMGFNEFYLTSYGVRMAEELCEVMPANDGREPPEKAP